MLRVFRVLLADDALVIGAVSQAWTSAHVRPSSLTHSDPQPLNAVPPARRIVRHPAAGAAEQHLHGAEAALGDASLAGLARLGSLCAAGAAACALPSQGASGLQAALRGCADELAGLRRGLPQGPSGAPSAAPPPDELAATAPAEPQLAIGAAAGALASRVGRSLAAAAAPSQAVAAIDMHLAHLAAAPDADMVLDMPGDDLL